MHFNVLVWEDKKFDAQSIHGLLLTEFRDQLVITCSTLPQLVTYWNNYSSYTITTMNWPFYHIFNHIHKTTTTWTSILRRNRERTLERETQAEAGQGNRRVAEGVRVIKPWSSWVCYVYDLWCEWWPGPLTMTRRKRPAAMPCKYTNKGCKLVVWVDLEPLQIFIHLPPSA